MLHIHIVVCYILKFFWDYVRTKDLVTKQKLMAVSLGKQFENNKMLTLVKNELLKLHSSMALYLKLI